MSYGKSILRSIIVYCFLADIHRYSLLEINGAQRRRDVSRDRENSNGVILRDGTICGLNSAL